MAVRRIVSIPKFVPGPDSSTVLVCIYIDIRIQITTNIFFTNYAHPILVRDNKYSCKLNDFLTFSKVNIKLEVCRTTDDSDKMGKRSPVRVRAVN